MAKRADKHVLKNGMVVLGEPMEAVESVSFRFMLEAGASRLPAGCAGAGNVIQDWIFRGAGERNSRQLSEALDGLGLHRSAGVDSSHLKVGATLENENLEAALELYGDIILRPRLDDKEFAPARQLAMDSVSALDDNPRQKVMIKLREQFYPDPLGTSSEGDMEQLKALTVERTREIIRTRFDAGTAIFSVAGKYDFDKVCEQLERLFGDAVRGKREKVEIGKRGGKYRHIHNEGAQVHIAVMTEAPRIMDEGYYDIRTGVSVLSGGMSARLFTEVREKRGLCYAIGARYDGLKEAAGVACYAGTTPDKAQQTLDVVVEEFKKLKEGISDEELERAKTGLKSDLILNSESSSSRASAIGRDYYLLGRVRSLEEVRDKIEATNKESVLGQLKKRGFEDFTVATIGPKAIEI